VVKISRFLINSHIHYCLHTIKRKRAHARAHGLTFQIICHYEASGSISGYSKYEVLEKWQWNRYLAKHFCLSMSVINQCSIFHSSNIDGT